MGRNCVCEFDPELGALTQERRLIENDLVNAVENDLLELHYQPQAAVRSGEVVGFEALVRWNDPQRGFVPPAEFVPIAEENGLILKIGQWVLERACRDAMAWPDEQGYRTMLARLNSSREML
jgi:EAL domain-containing protein (putative c-di-GMP-specific phosphodiesterase class I)